VSLRYQSGDVVMVGDKVRYQGELGEIEFVVELGSDDPKTSWYLQTQGPGVMIAEPKVFGRVYVNELDGRLVLVARRSDCRRR
jgi:hypothetical protein